MLILFAACGFGVAGVLGAITAKDWSEDVLDHFPGAPLKIPYDILSAVGGDIEDIRIDIAATSVSNVNYSLQQE